MDGLLNFAPFLIFVFKINQKMNRILNGFVMIALALVSTTTFAQTSAKEPLPNGWYLQDLKESGVNGISLDKAYQFVKGKKSKTVLVAVIDSGVDTTHEDLKPVLWRNPKEIPGNKTDDDGNGYVDDIYGWNFIGGKDGTNLKQDSDEASRVYHKLKAKYGPTRPDPSLAKTPEEKAEIETYRKAKQKIEVAVDPAEILFIKRILPAIKQGDSIISKELGKAKYTCEDLKNYFPLNNYAFAAKSILMDICKINNNNNDITNKEVIQLYEKEIRRAEAAVIPPKPYR